MQAGREEHTGAALIDALKNADGDITESVAVIWTWLERNQRKLGSLRDKHTTIIESVLDSGEFTELTDGTLEWLAENPLHHAATLLVRIEQTFGNADRPSFEYSRGIDGSEVVVAWRASDLVKILGGGSHPQQIREYPGPAALAPRLLVCPRTVNEVDLEILEPEGLEWLEVQSKLDVAFACEDLSTFTVHLDTLGDHGMSGGCLEVERRVGRFDPSRMKAKDHDACKKAAKDAVAYASGPASMLVMPELAATPEVLATIASELHDTEEAPLLTVVGLYHDKPHPPPDPDPALGAAEWSEYVNDAVVLGPNGTELWRHRKLTAATADVDDDGGESSVNGEKSTYRVTEDIFLGSSLRLLPTPVGTIAVVTCLDAFASHARERIAKSPANVLLVPSLSRTVFRHRNSIQHLVQALWGAAFVCNRWTDPGSWNEERSRSFWAIDRRTVEIPDEKAPGEHPSFVFTASDQEEEKPCP